MKLLTTFGDEYLVLLADDEYEQLLHPVPPIRRAAVRVRHQAQNGPGADERRNDCGAACVAMLVGALTNAAPTVDDVAIRFQREPNQYMTFGDMIRAARSYGLNADYARPLLAAQMRDALDKFEILIVLVKYSALPDELQAIDFDGSHFIVVSGYGGDVFTIHDPLADSGGQIEGNDLEYAMRAFAPGENLHHQGLIIS